MLIIDKTVKQPTDRNSKDTANGLRKAMRNERRYLVGTALDS